MKLYKYTSFDTGMQIIKSSQMAITKPSDFNDPFDCLPVYSEEDVKQAQALMTGSILDSVILSSFREIHSHITNPFQKALIGFVLKEYDFAIWLYKKIRKHRLIQYKPIWSFEKALHFLEFCEKIKKSHDEISIFKNILLKHRETFLKNESDALMDFLNLRDRLYVLSLTSKNDSILMWSYYGQDHKGFCFEVEIDDWDSTLKKVEYCKERPTTPLTTLMSHICGQLFINGMRNDAETISNFNKLAFKPYITKSFEWKHENEYRLLISQESFGEIGITSKVCTDGKTRYMRNMRIIKIYLGASMNEDNKEIVRQAVSNQVEIIETSISEKTYELIV